MAKLWRLRPHDPLRLAQLQRQAGVPAVVAQLLLARGVELPDQIEQFLTVKLSQLRDPSLLPGASAAADRLLAALRAGRRIVVYGDYDVDGMTGTAILVECLRLLGGDVGYYVPHRIDEGYSLNHEALHTLAKQGTQTIVTVDCGIASVAESETARSLGIELIITDHHEFAASLPTAEALVHPRLPGGDYPFGGLSGSGVALKVAWALCQAAEGSSRVSERLKHFLLTAVGWAALGTVADVVPLLDENRVLVQYGLESLRERPGLGLARLLRLTELDRKQRLDADDLGFMLAPRLNAAGRLGQAQLGVELLTTLDPDRAQALAEYIHELNNSRQSLERSVLLAANKQVGETCDLERDPALVLAGHGWHPGVIGIVAGKLAEKFHRPVVVISLDETGARPGIGSARSIPGFNLHQALQACTEHLVGHGGHAAAAGLKIDPANIEPFREAFLDYAARGIDAPGRGAELWIDAETPLGLLTLATVEQIERLAPFGHGNARPLFCASGVELLEPPKVMGGGGRHLSFKLSQAGCSIRAVAFGAIDWLEPIQEATQGVDLAFRPVVNEFRGFRKVELHLVDWRPSETPVAARQPAVARQ